MSEQLTIREEKTEDHLVLVLNGRLDAYWSGILGEKMEECLHEGFYDLLLDTQGVSYMSSAGIRILIQYFRKLREIQGSLLVVRPSDQVRSVLEMAGMKMLMTAKEGRKEEADTHTGLEASIDQVRYMLEPVQPDACLRGMIIGSPADLLDGKPDPALAQMVPFHLQRYGVGIGAFGDSQEDSAHRMGEFIGLGDVIAWLPTDERKKPDYLIRTGKMVPKVNLLYGLLFEGQFSHMIRFEVSDMNRKVRLSQLTDHLRQLIPFERAGMLMVAESSGLVGVSLAADPMDREQSGPLFSFPEIKQQVTVTTEPDYSGMLALVTGIVSASGTDRTNGHFRPLSPLSPLLGHFHAAVFSYHPLKKHWHDPREVIRTLVEEHQFETILHLLNDQRTHQGIGESEFRAGTCWLGKISTMNVT